MFHCRYNSFRCSEIEISDDATEGASDLKTDPTAEAKLSKGRLAWRNVCDQNPNRS